MQTELFLKLEEHLDLKLLKRTLLVVLGVFCFAATVSLLWKTPGKTRETAKVPFLLNKNESSLRPLSEYEQAIRTSLFFGAEPTKGSLPVLKASMKELTKDFRLKGVVIMDEPEAIVMNARTNESLFVGVGDMLGEVTVKSIEEGRVVLSYFGQEREMKVL